MQLVTSIALALCALGFQGALATPIFDEPRAIGPLHVEPRDDNLSDLVRRAGTGNDPSDPIEAELSLDGDKLNMLPFEADCYAILCLGAPDVFASPPVSSTKIAGPVEFAPRRLRKGRASSVPKSPRPTHNGATGKHLTPSNAGASGAADGTWFKIKYTGQLGPYCKALMSNDKSVCDKNFNGGQGPWGFDVADYAHKFDKAGGKYDLVPRQ